MDRLYGLLFVIAGGVLILRPDAMKQVERVPTSRFVYRVVGTVFLLGGSLVLLFGLKDF